jgi:hypothetical protein
MATDVVSRVTTVIAVVDKATAPVTAIQRKLASLGTVASSIGRQFRAFSTQSGLSKLPGLLHSIHDEAIKVGKEFVHMMLPILGLGAGGATVAGLFDLAEGLNRFVEEGSRLNVVSTRIGTTVSTLQDLEYAASLVKVPTDVLDTNLGRLNRVLAQVAAGKNKEAVKVFGFIGLNARDAKGHVRSAADVMPQLADAIARIHNPAQRARLAVAAFGKGGQALIPMLALGSRGLALARKDMEQLGRMTAAETHEAHELEISQIRLHRAFSRVQEIIGAALAPYTKKAVDAVREWIVVNRQWLTQQIHVYVNKGADAVAKLWQNLRAVNWTAQLEKWKKWGQYALDIVARLGGVNRLLLIFGGLLVVSEVLEFGAALLTVATGIKAITLAMYKNPWIALTFFLIEAATIVYLYWNKIAHWVRYYSKVVQKVTDVTWGALYRAIAQQLGNIRDVVTRVLDDVVDRFTNAWSRLREHPMLRLLGILANPLGGLQDLFAGTPPGAAPGAPGQPAAGAPAEPWKGIPYARPPGGTVDVNLHINGAPAGSRATQQTKGRGLRTSLNVGYSMPHLASVG